MEERIFMLLGGKRMEEADTCLPIITIHTCILTNKTGVTLYPLLKDNTTWWQ